MYRSNYFLETLIFVLFLLTACTPVELSILEDSHCSPPCWQKIIPGKTTVEELENVMPELPLKSPGEMAYHRRYDGYRNYYIGELNTGEELLIAMLEGTVSRIYFSGMKEKYGLGITFEEAIETLGEPEFIYTLVGHGYRNFFGIPLGLHPVLYVIAISLDKGIWFTTGFPLDDNYNMSKLDFTIRPDNEVMELEFFDPNQFEELANKGEYSFGIFKYRELIDRMYPWAGYGELNTKYPYIP